MNTIRMFVDGCGVSWALAQCSVCGEVHKYLAADAVADAVTCKSCKCPMDLRSTVVAGPGDEPAAD